MEAGKIRITLDLNADDLASEITRAVQRELEPVLKKIQAEINKTARDLDKIDGRSFVEVAVDAKLAEREISKQAAAAEKAAVANEADAKALRDLAKAEAEFAAAQKSGDLVKRTAAMHNLAKATQAYEQATGKSAGAARDAVTDLDNMGKAAETAGRKRTAAEKAVQAEIERTQAAERRAARAAEDNARRAERAAQDAQIAAARRAAQDEANAKRRADKLAQIAAEAAKRIEVREAEDERRRLARHEQDVRAATARAARIQAQEQQRAERAAERETERLNRIATRDAERAARDAARAMNGGGGSGGGGPRGPAPGNRPSFGTGQYGGKNFITRFAMNPIGANTIGLGLAGIPAAIAGITSLAGAVQTLAQSGLAVPGIIGGIGVSAATAAVGVQGMKDAVTALVKAQKEDDPKEFAKAYDKLKDMAPAAQETAVAVANFVNGPWKQLTQSTQQTMFAGVAADLGKVQAAVGPRLQADMGKTAAAWNSTIHAITGQMTSGTNLSFMDRIFGNTADAQGRANRAIAPLTNAFLAITAQSSNFLPRLADGLTKVSTRFDNFVNKSINNGNFDRWIDQGLTGMDKLGNSALNFGKAIEGVFHASGGSGFLQWLQDASGRLERFVNSTEGQNKIGDFFKQAREDAALWKPVLGDIFKLFSQMVVGAQQWSHILLPFLSEVMGTLTRIPGLVSGVTTAFLAWRTISGVTDLLGKLKGIGTSLETVGGKSGKARAACDAACNCAVGGMGGGKGGAGGAGGAAGGRTEEERTGRGGRFLRGAGGVLGALGLGVASDQFMQGIDPDNRSGGGTGGWLQAVGGGAGTGALIGSFIEPGIGTAVGAAIGAAGGALIKGIETMFAENKPTAPSAVMPGALAPDQYRALIQQINQPGPAPGQVWNQQSVDQAVYGTSGSFDPRTFGFDQLKKGSQGYSDMLTKIAGAGIPGVNADNAAQTLDQVIKQAQDAKVALDKLGGEITTLPTGEVVLTDPTPAILDRVKQLGGKLTTLPNGLISVDTTQLNAADRTADQLKEKLTKLFLGQGQGPEATPPANVTDLPSYYNYILHPPGRARGGVLPGWSPGHDNMLVPMAGGEGVLIPQAVWGLGGPTAIDSINDQFRHGGSGVGPGYAGGGVVGPIPWYPDSDVLGSGPGSGQRNQLMLLTEIKNLLAGSTSGPLSSMKNYMQNIATGGVPAGMLPKGTTPGRIGPFGTPIAPHNMKYDMLAGALRGLGGDPDYVLGPDPVKYAQSQWGELQTKLKELESRGGLGALGRSSNPKDYVGPLSQFAQSGQLTPDMVKMGLDANNPVVTAIMNARNSKGYEQVPGYISQVLGQGAFTGQLTPENQAIISALSTFQQAVAKQATVDQELELLLAPLGGMKGLQAQILANPSLAAGLPASITGGLTTAPGGAPAAAPGVGGVPGAPSGFNWDAVLPHEGGTWNNADTGHNQRYGGLQFSADTWADYGGLAVAPRADQATPEQQKMIADRVAFYGWNGKPPQGLKAWQAIRDNKVPGVTVNSQPPGGLTPPPAAAPTAGLPTVPPPPGLPAVPPPPGLPAVPPPATPPAGGPPGTTLYIDPDNGKHYWATSAEDYKRQKAAADGTAPPAGPAPAGPAPADSHPGGWLPVGQFDTAHMPPLPPGADAWKQVPGGAYPIKADGTPLTPAGPAAPAAPAPAGGGKAPDGAVWMPFLNGYIYQGHLHTEWAPPGGAGGMPTPSLPGIPNILTPTGPSLADVLAPGAAPAAPAPPSAPPPAPAPAAPGANVPPAGAKWMGDGWYLHGNKLPGNFPPPGPGQGTDAPGTVLPGRTAGGAPPPVAPPTMPTPPAGPAGVAPTGLPYAAGQQAAMGSIDQFAQAVSGHSYKWGGHGEDGGLYDCSGFMGAIWARMTGKPMPDQMHWFSTADDLTRFGFKPTNTPVPGAFNVGVSPSHMAGTLPSGINVEAGGSGNKVQYGGSAAGAFDPQFSQHYYLDPSQVIPGMVAGAPGGGMPGGLNSAGGIVPVYVVNMGGGAGGGGMGNMLQNLLGGPIGAAGSAAGDVAGDALGAAATDVPSAFLSSAGAAAPAANALALAQQGNPLAITAALGYKVPDLSRAGAVQLAGATFANPAQQYMSDGRMLSNTSGLYGRSMTDIGAQLNAMRDQMVGATKDVSKGLGEKVLTPIMKTGVNTGISTLSSTVLTSMGTQLGNAMAPPIGAAVAKAAPASGGSDAAGLAASPFDAANAVTSTIGLAGGGGVSGGIAGKDSVPSMLMPNEWVLTTDEVGKMGGFGGMQRFTAALGRSHGLHHFAAGGGVIGNATVGGDFFGVSQVPFLGAIFSMMINILLTMIGAQITVRNTLTALTDNFRQFRGDTFKAFDAQGRLFTDTSGLSERSQTSAQTATDERVRILTQVLQALIKYIIDKVIVPISEAVGQALINAGASAAGGALGPFGGGAISGGASTIGDAAVQIAGQVGQDFGDAASQVIVAGVAQGLTQSFPGLATGIFSGAGIENAVTGPLGGLLGGVVGGFSGLLTALLGIVGLGTFGGRTGTLLGFDEGGVAEGVGMMPKATIHPERVLSPSQTNSFERLVSALEGGNFGGGNTTTIHAPFTVTGGAQGASDARDRLLELIS